MLPFGKINNLGVNRTQAAGRLSAALEAAGCEVSWEGNGRLRALMPGWDDVLPWFDGAALPIAFHQAFRDRMVVSIGEDGSARYSLSYWSGAQPALHACLGAVLASDAWLSPLGSLSAPALISRWFLAHGALALLTAFGFGLSVRGVLRGAAIRAAFPGTE